MGNTLRIVRTRRLQRLDSDLPNLDMPATAAEFLEADMALARSGLEGRGVGAVVALGWLGLLIEVDVEEWFPR